MHTSHFNSPLVQNLLSQNFSKLRELRIWVRPAPGSLDVPYPFIVSANNHPQLDILSLTGVQISMYSSFNKTLYHLELCEYPPGAQPIERFQFTALLNSIASLRTLLLRSYLGNTSVDEVQQCREHERLFREPFPIDEYPVTRIKEPLDSMLVEDSAHKTAEFVSSWMDLKIPQNTEITAVYGVNDVINRLMSPVDEVSLFIDALTQRPACEHPLSAGLMSPEAFKRVTAARLSFNGECITLACTGYPEHEPDASIPLVLRLQLKEFTRLDRQTRVRVHAMALKSVRWVLCDAARCGLRSLEVVDVSDDVCADAWLEFVNTISCVENPELRVLTLTQEQGEAGGHAREELLRALRCAPVVLPVGLQVFHKVGTMRAVKIFEVYG